MTVSLGLAAVLANSEHGWVWAPFVTVLWVALAAGVAWLVVRRIRPREATGVDRAREILAERYARGELTSDEYRERLDQLS